MPDFVPLSLKEKTLCPLCLCGELTCAKLGIQDMSANINTTNPQFEAKHEQHA